MENLKELRERKEIIRLQLWDLCHDKNVINEQEHTRKIFELSKEQTELIEKLAGQEEQVVVLRVDKAVAIEHAVAVMDIAYRNKFKIVLATQQKK